MTEAERLRAQAERCLRFAKATGASDVADTMRELAAHYLSERAGWKTSTPTARAPHRPPSKPPSRIEHQIVVDGRNRLDRSKFSNKFSGVESH